MGARRLRAIISVTQAAGSNRRPWRLLSQQIDSGPIAAGSTAVRNLRLKAAGAEPKRPLRALSRPSASTLNSALGRKQTLDLDVRNEWEADVREQENAAGLSTQLRVRFSRGGNPWQD